MTTDNIETVLVTAGGAEFYAQVMVPPGPATIRAEDGPYSFEGVGDALEAVAAELGRVWQNVRPSEATVEFGLALTAKPGKLTALFVEGGAEANLKVTLTWKAQDNGTAG